MECFHHFRPFYEQQGSQPWIQKQNMNDQWVRAPDQWSQQTWQWNPQQQPQGPWGPQQQFVSQQQPVVQRLWGSEQPQWGTGQQQWMPQQQWVPPQWVPQQSSAEQLRSSYNIWMPYVLNRKWNQQKQSLNQDSSLWQGWSPEQQWIQPVSQQQWVPQVTEEQKPAYNPLIAHNLNQIWYENWSPYPMRDKSTVGEFLQSFNKFKVNGFRCIFLKLLCFALLLGHIITIKFFFLFADYPWQPASLNRGLVY